VWMTVAKARLKGRRNRYEDTVLLRLQEVLPPGVKVTILADRGFGDQHLYAYLTDLGFEPMSANVCMCSLGCDPYRRSEQSLNNSPPSTT